MNWLFWDIGEALKTEKGLPFYKELIFINEISICKSPPPPDSLSQDEKDNFKSAKLLSMET